MKYQTQIQDKGPEGTKNPKKKVKISKPRITKLNLNLITRKTIKLKQSP